MSLFSKNRLPKTDHSDLESSYALLKENIVYGQRLAKMGSWTHNIKTDEIFLTDEVYHILGCGSEAFDGKLENFYSFVHPDDLQQVKEATQGALTGDEYDLDYRIVTPEGQTRFVHEKTKLIYDQQNNPLKMVGIIHDMTEHKLSEETLKEFGDELIRAQRVAGVGSWKYDIIKHEYYCTEELYRIYNFNPTEQKIDLQSLLKQTHPEDRALVQETIGLHLAGQTRVIEYRIIQKDGSVKYAESRGEPVFGENGQVVGIIGTLQDKTENKLMEQKLREANKLLTQAQSLAHIGSWDYDLVHRKNHWSDEAFAIYGITPEQYDNQYESFLKFIYPEDVHILNEALANPSAKPVEMNFRIVRPDGSVRNIYQLMEYVFNEEGALVYLYGTIQDVTESKRLQEEIAHKQEEISRIQRRFNDLIQESCDVCGILDTDGTIRYISDAAERVTGFSPTEFLGFPINIFYDETQRQKITAMIDAVLESPGKSASSEFEFKNKAGDNISLDISIRNLLHNTSIQGISFNLRDITDKTEMVKKIKHISTHDDLTGLPNLTYFRSELQERCDKASINKTKLAVMMLDIDRLKDINGTLGYKIGDLLMTEAAKRLIDFFPDSVFISRYWGERFLILFEGPLTQQDFENHAKEIIQLFSKPVKLAKFDLDANINVGASVYHGNEKSVDILISQAEYALLWAQREKQNCYKFYSSDSNIKDYKQFELRSDLKKAISGNQLRVYYQPIVKLKNSELLGAEALIRWEHPVWGLISPAEFISLAEETGFIIDIGYWVLREVCKSYKKWLQEGLSKINIAVNYSGIQFYEHNIADNIKKIIDEFELDPHFLIIEITETVLMTNTDKVVADIGKLQSYGIQIAIDDFGTGFSSLSYLNTLNLDVLKIDGSFIRNIFTDDKCVTIFQSIIHMARNLNIKLVIEGIETWEQLTFLLGQNCYTGQGYLFSRPMPITDFEKILIKKKCKPTAANNSEIPPHKERRRYFRLSFIKMLETDMTIKLLKDKIVNVGNTKVLIKNLSEAGLCFISNIRLPVNRGMIWQFVTKLNGVDVVVNGHIQWSNEKGLDLFEYGVEFVIEESDRIELIKLLNIVQIKISHNYAFSEGRFITDPPVLYFKKLIT